MNKLKIVVFTGAGISRESGLKTFRDSDGLWEGHSVEDVCTTKAWRTQPEVVLNFYNDRRREVMAAQPNAAHEAISQLQQAGHEVMLVTQNIDDLHERAGTTDVVHLHGQIMMKRGCTDKRSHRNSHVFEHCNTDIKIGELDNDGNQYRPVVVFFGEMPYDVQKAIAFSQDADILLAVGSTLEVYPAACVVEETGAKHIWIVDPVKPKNKDVQRMENSRNVKYILEAATTGVPKAVEEILEVTAK